MRLQRQQLFRPLFSSRIQLFAARLPPPGTPPLMRHNRSQLRKKFERIVLERYEPKIMEATAQYDINQLTSNDPVIQDKIMSSIMRYDDFYFSLVLDFVKTHPGSIFSVYLANKEMKSSYEKGKLLFEALTPEMRISAMGKSLQEELEIL